MTGKKSGFFTTTPTMPVDYNSQSAAGGPAVNPVVAPGLAIPAPCLAQKPNCCTYFQLSQFETNLKILINNCIYAILTLPFTIKTISASQNIVPGRVLFVNLQRCQTVKQSLLHGYIQVQLIFPLTFIIFWAFSKLLEFPESCTTHYFNLEYIF